MSLLSWIFEYSDVREMKYEGKRLFFSISTFPSFADKVKGAVEALGGVVGNE
jgi:hypothetical protein